MNKILVGLLIVLIPFSVKCQPGQVTAKKNGPYALIAGGSKGIGYAIAEALARRNYNLVLVARNTDTLLLAKNRLESAYQISVSTLSYDLSREESATEIAKWCTENDIQLKMLCNVAGLGG